MNSCAARFSFARELHHSRNVTIRTCIRVVCTLIDNDIRHHSGQNVVDSRDSSEQRCLDSYRLRQISQSDCEITSTCGKNAFL